MGGGVQAAIKLASMNADFIVPRDPVHSADGESYHKLWDAMEQCWKFDPKQRATMEEVLIGLSE